METGQDRKWRQGRTRSGDRAGQEVETGQDRKGIPSRTGSGDRAGQEVETEHDRKCSDDLLSKALQTMSLGTRVGDVTPLWWESSS